MKIFLTLSAAAVLATVAPAEARQDKKPAPTQKEIDDAVWRGVDYLKTAPSPGSHLQGNCDALILLTLIHVGIDEKNPVFQKLLKSIVEEELKHTYKVALQAMCLEDLDPTRYQYRIAQCAQFLVDNQCANGQWSYGSPTEFTKEIPSVPFKADVASEPKKKSGVVDFGATKKKSKPTTKYVVKKMKPGPGEGDNSNTQYAALGLRACHDANVVLPQDVLHLARKWLVESQWESEDGAAGKAAVGTGGDGAAPPKGWNYTNSTRGADQKPYHPMTAGAVGAVCIYEYMLGRDWKKDKVANSGMAWLGAKFAVNTNYYYMYGLERAGMLYGTERIGAHDWYLEGAREILDHQNADGSWGARGDKAENTWDTCFAILFLKKATKAIATGDQRK